MSVFVVCVEGERGSGHYEEILMFVVCTVKTKEKFRPSFFFFSVCHADFSNDVYVLTITKLNELEFSNHFWAESV